MPIYYARWELRALCNDTNSSHTRTHARTRTHSHTHTHTHTLTHTHSLSHTHTHTHTREQQYNVIHTSVIFKADWLLLVIPANTGNICCRPYNIKREMMLC